MNIEIIVPIVRAPTKLCSIKWSGKTPRKKMKRIGTSISGMKEPTINPGKTSFLLIFDKPHATG